MRIYRVQLLAAAVLGLWGCGSSENPSSSVSSSSSSSVESSVSSSYSSQSSVSSSSSSSQIVDSVDTGVSLFTDLPAEMRVSADGERLERGGFYTSKLYDETQLETVYLDFEQPDYWTQLTNNYASKTEIPATLRYKDKVLEQVGVRFRGMTSYMRAGDKKSFSIDLEYAIDGQDINGYNELKLNNAYEDPSSMREVLYSNLARKNIASAKGSFVNLVVNGENFGIYANIQKLEKDHAKEWFLDKEATRWRAEAPSSGTSGGFGGFGGGGGFGAGRSTLNNLGSDGSAYEGAYTLKHSAVENPWQDLANAAYTMGVTSHEYLIEELSQYMDIDAALWFIATENIFTDDDGYINKGGMDYYVYFDIATGRIVPLEYDGNSAMSLRLATSWGPLHKIDDTNFPLMNILLNIPQLQQRYLAHYRTIMAESLKPEIANEKMDAYAELIGSSMAASVPVREYSYSEYLNGVDELRNYFVTRYNFLQSNSDINRTGVGILSVQDSVAGIASARPSDSQAVDVELRIASVQSVREINLYHGTGLMGSFTKMTMNGTGDTFTAQIPPAAKGEYVRYYVEVIANDTAGTATYSPIGAEHDVYIYQVKAANLVETVVKINEIMPANKTVATDEEGEYGDWIELYNTSNSAVDLSGWYLTDEDIKLTRWAFPEGTRIEANDTLIIWADDKEDLTTGLHANFKLSAAGESVYLVTPELDFADKLNFADAQDDWSYARSPNGSGEFTWTASPTFDGNN